jgi:hypothetical protein
MKAKAAKTSTEALSEIVIETKLIRIGESPKNRPINPAKPKLSATDNTSVSTTSRLVFTQKQQVNQAITRQKSDEYETDKVT